MSPAHRYTPNELQEHFSEIQSHSSNNQEPEFLDLFLISGKGIEFMGYLINLEVSMPLQTLIFSDSLFSGTINKQCLSSRRTYRLIHGSVEKQVCFFGNQTDGSNSTGKVVNFGASPKLESLSCWISGCHSGVKGTATLVQIFITEACKGHGGI